MYRNSKTSDQVNLWQFISEFLSVTFGHTTSYH